MTTWNRFTYWKIFLENLPRGGEFKIFSFANCEWLVNVTSYTGVRVGEFSSFEIFQTASYKLRKFLPGTL
jgi:hypothetical protein